MITQRDIDRIGNDILADYINAYRHLYKAIWIPKGPKWSELDTSGYRGYIKGSMITRKWLTVLGKDIIVRHFRVPIGIWVLANGATKTCFGYGRINICPKHYAEYCKGRGVL